MTKKDANQPLRENIDYTLDDQGNFVFSRSYLLARGHCCQSGCTHCPYDYSSKVDPNVPAELQNPWGDEDEELLYHYDYDEEEETKE